MNIKIKTILKKIYSRKRKTLQGCCTASLKRFEKDKKVT